MKSNKDNPIVKTIMDKIYSLTTDDWITVYEIYKDEKTGIDIFVYSGIIKDLTRSEILVNQNWEVNLGDGMPGYIVNNKGKSKTIKYDSGKSKSEVLVYDRSTPFGDKVIEISEEFRLFFNLFEQSKNRNRIFVEYDDAGEENEVVIISEKNVKIKSYYLQKFITIKDSRLVLYFDMRYEADETIFTNDVIPQVQTEKVAGLCYETHFYNILQKPWNMHGLRIFGKKVIKSENKDILKNYFELPEKRYENFIIGKDNNHKVIEYSCNKDMLANIFGANRGTPHYLTIVSFKKQVLKKYYDDTRKYRVVDGYVECGNLWGLRIDNSHEEAVNVYLGDLSDLSYEEQKYWRSFNIPPVDKVSNTYFRRSILGEFAAPEAKDLIFKNEYEKFQKYWVEKYGWYLFKPLNKNDEYHLERLKIPLKENIADFESQIASLVKIIIDSLNEEELIKGLTKLNEGTKGIGKLELYLESKNVDGKETVEFFRRLQSLRSTAIAHRKSEKNKDFKKDSEYFNLSTVNYDEIYIGVLDKVVKTFNLLRSIQ